MDASAVITYLVSVAVSLLVLFFIIRGAVLSALNAHAAHEREFARKVAAERTRQAEQRAAARERS